METITARFNWTAEDLLTGRKFALKLNRWSPFGFGVALLAAIVLGISVSGAHLGKHGGLSAFIIGGLILFGIIIGVPLAKRISQGMIRRQFAKRPDAGAEIVWEISEQLIIIRSENSNSENQWSVFQQVIFTPGGFLFMPNKQVFNFIPNRAFENEMEIGRLKALARHQAKEFREIK